MDYHIKYVHFLFIFKHHNTIVHVCTLLLQYAFLLLSFVLLGSTYFHCVLIFFLLKKLVFSIEILPHFFVHDDECAERMKCLKLNKLLDGTESKSKFRKTIRWAFFYCGVWKEMSCVYIDNAFKSNQNTFTKIFVVDGPNEEGIFRRGNILSILNFFPSIWVSS